MRFIWKWEHERPKSMPANIMTSKWVPLQELLGKILLSIEKTKRRVGRVSFAAGMK